MSEMNLTTPKMEKPTGLAMTMHQWKTALQTKTPYLMTFGIALWLGAYYLFVEGWELPRFNK